MVDTVDLQLIASTIEHLYPEMAQTVRIAAQEIEGLSYGFHKGGEDRRALQDQVDRLTAEISNLREALAKEMYDRLNGTIMPPAADICTDIPETAFPETVYTYMGVDMVRRDDKWHRAPDPFTAFQEDWDNTLRRSPTR